MSGIKNDVVFAKNADFTSVNNTSPSESNGLVTDAKLWIGSTVTNAGGTHINVGQLTSPDNSLTFGYSTPNITAIVNRTVVQDLHTARYIVSAGGLTDGANYTSIQSAINAAQATGVNQTVFIQPGTYTENITLVAGVNLCAYGPTDAFGTTPSNVIINGTCTMTTAGTVGIKGIRLQTNSAAALAVTGSAASIVLLENCYLNCTNNTGITLSSSSSSSLIEFFYCSGDITTTGIALFAHSGAGVIRFWYSSFYNSGSSTTANTISGGGFCGPNYSSFANGFSLSSSSGLNGGQNNYHPSTAQVCITTSGTSSVTEIQSQFVAGASSALSIGSGTSMTIHKCFVGGSTNPVIAGSGTLSFTDLSMNSNANLSGTLTISNGSMNSYFSGAGTGTTGQVLTSNGATSPPTWQAAGSSASGTVVQQVRTSVTTATSVATVLALTGTTPTTSNTSSLTTLAITPTSASNILYFEFEAPYELAVAGTPTATIALFENTTFKNASCYIASANGNTIRYSYYYTAPSTSSITYDLRAAVSANTLFLLQTTTSTAFYNGAGNTAMTFTITEVKP